MRGPEGRGEVEVAVSGIAGLQCSDYSMQIIEVEVAVSYGPMLAYNFHRSISF
jgi:hypothetical protein